MSAALQIVEDDLSGDAVRDLLQLHHAELQEWSPPGTVHALPLKQLRASDVAFYTAWQAGVLAGFGALKQLDAHHGEIKSMRAAPGFRGKGIGRAILLHLIEIAQKRGLSRLSLETGRTIPYDPARKFYRANGFAECPPFAEYQDDGFSTCMTLRL